MLREHPKYPSWLAFAFGALAVAAACGGSSGSTANPPGSNGSVICGTNGATDCGNRKCDPSLGCVECLANGDCPATAPICVHGSCSQCGSNADCPASTPACWLFDRKCHPA